MLFDIMAMMMNILEMHFSEIAQELFYCFLFAPHHPAIFHYLLEVTHLVLSFSSRTVYSCSLLPHMIAFFNSAWPNLHLWRFFNVSSRIWKPPSVTETNHLSDLALDSPLIGHSTIISMSIWHHAEIGALQLPCASFAKQFSMVSSHPKDPTKEF